MVRRDRSCVFFLSVVAVLALSGCGSSEHKVFDGDDVVDDGAGSGTVPGTSADGGSTSTADGGSSTTDGGSDAGATPVVTACSGSGGVTVSGTIAFAGSVPEKSPLYVSWKVSDTAIPTCYVKVDSPRFPLAFRFDHVSPSAGVLLAYIHVGGAFPPSPKDGDFLVEVPAADLDLTHDVTRDLVIPTTPYKKQ